MRLMLKLRMIAIAAEIVATRRHERHLLAKGRKMLGLFSKKHKKGEKKPEPPIIKLPENFEHIADNAYLRRWNLEHHRKNHMRRQARACNIAYGFMRGLPYAKIESACCYQEPNWADVEDIISAYTEEPEGTWRQRLAEWLEEAQAFFKKYQLDPTYRIKKADLPKVATAAA